MKQIIMIASVLVLASCTMESTVTSEHEVHQCTDTRDGEKFSFQVSDITNIRVGFGGADSCFDIVDDAGKKRTLCKSQELFIKCVAGE